MDTDALPAVALGLITGTVITPPAIWLLEHLGGTLPPLPALAALAALLIVAIYSV